MQKNFETLKDDILELMQQGYGRVIISKKLGISGSKATRYMRKIKKELSEAGEDIQLLEELWKQARSKQKLTDKNRIVNKILRENFRQKNAIEEYIKEFIQLLKKQNFTKTIPPEKQTNSDNPVGIIHLSDLHFNEKINLPHNQYNFSIASKRLYYFAQQIKKIFQTYNINEVLITLTGDLLNSDRRLDEILNAATNRVQATFLATDILQQFIRDIATEYYVTVTSVTGNESRIPQDVGWTDNVASDNYDVMIFNILKYILVNYKNINFIQGGITETVININGFNILLLHGHGAINSNIEKSIEQIKGRYAGRGIIIDYVIIGHKHSAIISDTFARCSSLSGSNTYNEHKLNLYSKASQNIYILHPNKLIDGIKIDLQLDNGPEYDYNKALEAYNSQFDKIKKKHTIFEVVI
ncbi:MAG: hypothetical protein ACP6IQ_02215 [Candidatus Njordarchaeia archaeon]